MSDGISRSHFEAFLSGMEFEYGNTLYLYGSSFFESWPDA